MSDLKFKDSVEIGPHKALSQLAGNWKGTTKVWFSPEAVHDESPVSGTIRLILGGMFALHEYKGSFEGKELEGLAIIGYHLTSGTYQTAWIDSFHMGTGIMFSEGTKNDDFLSVVGHYQGWEEQPQTWGWRTSIDIVDEDHITITAYNISPEGEEQVATQTEYHRVM
jgi:hypothetical protein